MLGSSSSTRCAAEAVHHPGCSSAGPRRKRLKTSHSLQRFANRFVDPWAFPAIQLDELTIEVVVETRSTAKSEHSSSSASSSETIRPFKNEAQRPKSASSVAKVLPVSPTKLKPACAPPTEGLSQLKGKNLCELLQPEEDFGRLETKEFYEATAPVEKYFKKGSTILESSIASKRKREEVYEENISKVVCEAAAPAKSTNPTLCLNSNSQFEIVGPNEINGHAFEMRGSSLPSISNMAANLLQLNEDTVICKTDEGDPSFPDFKLEAIEPATVRASKHQNVPQTTRSLATGVTKSMAMVVPTAKASQTVAAVRPQPSNQLVIMQNEPTSSVAQHLSLAQVPSVLDGMAPTQSWVPPTVVQAPPSYYVVDQSSPVQFYTHGPAMPHVVIEAPPPVMPAEVLQICNPINSSGFPVLQAGNNSPVLQPFTLMPASAALQQPVNNISQAALPSGFWQAGPHNQLPRTSQSCSTRLSTSASPVSAPTHQRAACAGQRPRTILNLHAKINASDACELNHQERISSSSEAQCSRDIRIVKQEISKCGMEEGSIDSSLSRKENVGLSLKQPFALQSTSSSLERFNTNSLESSSNDLLGIKNCSLSFTSVGSELPSSLSNENFLLVENKGEVTSQRSCNSTDRDSHLVPNSCSNNWDIGLQSKIVGGEPNGVKPSLSNFNKPVKVKCHFTVEKYGESPVDFSTLETKFHKDVAKNGLNSSIFLGSNFCSFHKLNDLVSLRSLIYPKSERNSSIMGASEFLRNDSSVTAFYTILNDWFTRPCCSAFSHLATICQTISISVLYDWQVSHGFSYGLKVPRLLPSLLRRKEKKSSLMALLCFRKVKNERLDHAVHFLEEKKDSVCNSCSPSDLVASSKQSFKENGDPLNGDLVVYKKQVVGTLETVIEKMSNNQNPATNIDVLCGDEGASSLSDQQVQVELVGPLDSENRFGKEFRKSVLETQLPRVDVPVLKLTQLSDVTTLTDLPSKSLCTFDTVSLFSKTDVSFSSIAKSFESGILELNEIEVTDHDPHEEFLSKKTLRTSITSNRSHFRWRSGIEKSNNPVHSCDATLSANKCDPTILPNSDVSSSSHGLDSMKPTFKKKESCLVEHNKTYQRTKKPKWGMGDLPAKTASDKARSVYSTLNSALSSLAGHKADQLGLNDYEGGFYQRLDADIDGFNRKFNQKSTLKMLLSETKIDNQKSSVNICDSDLSSISMGSSDDCTSSFGKLRFDLTSAISSVELKNTEANRPLSHQGWYSRLQFMNKDSGRMNIHSDTEIDNVSTVSEVASSSSVDSDTGSLCNSREDEEDEEASSVVELPNDDDAYKELLKCGYEVSKPSLKFPSETRIGPGSQISFKVYGKVKKAPCKKLPKFHKKKRLSAHKKKRDKKLKKMFKSRIARQTVDDIISARQPAEMPSHIIVSVQGKLFMYDDQVL